MVTQPQRDRVYRIARRDIGGLRYTRCYDAGDFIHVRVLDGPDANGWYHVTTRGEDGEHLGPGGGWHGTSDLQLLPVDLEEIPGT